jgi:hypothetical protein
VQVSASFGPGHQVHMVDVDDSMGSVADAGDYLKQLHSYLKP